MIKFLGKIIPENYDKKECIEAILNCERLLSSLENAEANPSNFNFKENKKELNQKWKTLLSDMDYRVKRSLSSTDTCFGEAK